MEWPGLKTNRLWDSRVMKITVVKNRWIRGYMFPLKLFNPLQSGVAFLYPLKISENLKVF